MTLAQKNLRAKMNEAFKTSKYELFDKLKHSYFVGPFPEKFPFSTLDEQSGIHMSHTNFITKPQFKSSRHKYLPTYLNSFGKKQTVFLWQFGPFTDNKGVASLTKSLKQLNQLVPKLDIIMCANDIHSRNIFNDLGLSTILCNHNAKVKTDIFTIDKNIQAMWDSVYIASITPYKRHFLSYDLNNICYIAGMLRIDAKRRNRADIEELYKEFCGKIKNNDSTLFIKRLYPKQVSLINNMSKVGLCLSKKEGAMFASIEYLLCGLPIVSTRSAGGRDEFFTDKNCIFAEDNAESVKQCVDEWLNNYPTIEQRQQIREDAIALQEEHIGRLKCKIKEVIKEQGGSVDIDKILNSREINNGQNTKTKM